VVVHDRRAGDRRIGPDETTRSEELARALAEAGRCAALISEVQQRDAELSRAYSDLAGANRELAQAVIALEDYRERLEVLVADLQRVNTELVDAAAVKAAFLRDMSHELKTPLNSIIGFSAVLGGGVAGDLGPEQKKQVDMIHTSGQHLLGVVNDMLDAARLESGRLTPEAAAFDVERLVADVSELVGPMLEEGGLDLSWEVAADTGAIVSDRRRIEQILLNLLGNAIKFTASGSIRITAAREDGDIVFAVSDTGSGMTREDLTRIFDEFYRVHDPDIARVDGTGLGLSVSKGLVDLLGGRIDVESELGVGTVFTVVLPVDPERAPLFSAVR
jgi:signal transduction histidine kinase